MEGWRLRPLESMQGGSASNDHWERDRDPSRDGGLIALDLLACANTTAVTYSMERREAKPRRTKRKRKKGREREREEGHPKMRI